MSQIILKDSVKVFRSEMRVICSDLLDVAKTFGSNDKNSEALAGQILHIQENFLFVIVGEVKAGKSSLINALLNDPSICATDFGVCTSEVQKITYGPSKVIVPDNKRKIVVSENPNELLKYITIVDTPGTNSIVEDHQSITEGFIPYCNLVVFVFEMNKIYVESAWRFLDLIKSEWGKKIIFVMTQSDRYTPEEVEHHHKNLQKTIFERTQIQDPTIFITSSLLETKGDLASSGFVPLRQYINGQVLETAAETKSIDDLRTVKTITTKIDTDFAFREKAFNEDLNSRNKILKILKEREDLALQNIENLVLKCNQLVTTQNETTLTELRNGVGFSSLTFRSIKTFFGGETTEKWLKRINEEHRDNLNKSIDDSLKDGIDKIQSDLQYMIIGIKDELDNLRDRDKSQRDLFIQLNDKRNEIVSGLKASLNDFIRKSNVFSSENVLKGNLDYNVTNTAVGIAAISAALTAISNAAILDITGGIATISALIIAGGFAANKKTKFMADIEKELEQKGKNIIQDLDQNLKKYTYTIRQKINDQFEDLNQFLEQEQQQIDLYHSKMNTIREQVKQLEKKTNFL